MTNSIRLALVLSALSTPVLSQENPCDRNIILFSNTFGPSQAQVDRMKENLFCEDDRGYGLLHLIHNPYALQELLNTNVQGRTLDPNKRGTDGRTPLFFVEYVESAEVLVNAGANPLVRSVRGATPLFTARDPVIVEYLLGLGVDPTAIDRTGGTALHEADDPRSIQLLIEAGADPNARDDEGYTPFLITMYDPESIEVARALLDAGADPYISNIYGMTALHLAESAELIRLVVSHADDPAHVDIEATNNGGLTPLHLAAFWNRADVIEELLLMGASPAAATHDGETPFDLVSQGCDSGLVLDCMVGTEIYWRLNDLRFE